MEPSSVANINDIFMYCTLDSSDALARNEKMLAARARMQEEYNTKVESYKEKKKEVCKIIRT